MQEDQPAADTKTAPRVAGLEALTDAEIAMLPADFFTAGGPRVVVIDRTVVGPVLLRKAELARILGVAAYIINRWHRADVLPCVRTPGGDRRYILSDVLDALRKAAPSVKRPPREGWKPPMQRRKEARLAAEKAAAEAVSPVFVNPFASLTA